MNHLTNVIPASQRKKLYAIFAMIGVLLGAMQVGYASAGVHEADWLNVALSVYAFLGGAFGLTANANTHAE